MTKIAQIRSLLDSMGTPEQLAEQFCELDDDQQAKFFVAVAEIMDGWNDRYFGSAASYMQASLIGSHLATCSCSTEGARDFVRHVFEGMSNPGHGEER